MKITLQRIQVVERLSDETTCFSATILIDGRPVGSAQNRGHGGATEIHMADRELEEKARAFAAAQYPDRTFEPFESLIDGLVEDYRRAKDEKRIARKRDALRRKLQADPRRPQAIIELELDTGEILFSPSQTFGTARGARDLFIKHATHPVTRWQIVEVATGAVVEAGP